MTGFYDSFLLRLDDKGRLVLPVAFRRAFEEQAGHVVWRGPYLALYPKPAWERFADNLRAQVDARVMTPVDVGQVFALSAQVTPDKQGRITVPTELRREVGIETEVRCAGFDSHIALWSEARWQAQRAVAVEPPEGRTSLIEKLDGIAFL